MNSKSDLRKWAKGRRCKLDMEVKSKYLIAKLVCTKEYQQAKNIMLFYPLLNEVNLLPLLNDESKIFYLPRIEGDNLLCCSYKKGEELCVSCFKTLEPTTKSVEKSFIDLAVIPALVADKNNYRLGYGGGFYDRFLKDFKGKTIICIPEELIVNTIFPEEFDIPVDKVIF